ncbi:hypothetical protein Aperf_G00000054978 [Anoplocephala perfoliata]
MSCVRIPPISPAISASESGIVASPSDVVHSLPLLGDAINSLDRFSKQAEKTPTNTNNSPELETIQAEILPLISNIEEDYQAMISLSDRGNTVESVMLRQLFECSQGMKNQINALSVSILSIVYANGVFTDKYPPVAVLIINAHITAAIWAS